MIEETFFHTLPDGENAKFTISSKIIENNIYYYASVVGIDIDYYQKLSEHEKQDCIGIEVLDDNQNIVYYINKSELKLDIIDFYGTKRLHSKIQTIKK